MGALPRRGEIWFAALPTEPHKVRPVVIVSLDGRNENPKAFTVLAIPLTTSPHHSAMRIPLGPGETGLRERSSLAADNITIVRKEDLLPARTPLRQLGELRLRDAARGVLRAMGFPEGAVS
jgi:mRNA-degrading endonuclease toxin of MazEF toxin-antitoxin module